MTRNGRWRAACPIISRIVVLAEPRPGIRSAPPAQNAAGSIATASARKNSAPTCQAWRPRRACVASGTSKVPSDPAAATSPSVWLRRASETARATAVIASEEAMHDKATPISAPETISAGTPPAAAMMASPTT